jgi:hypothetical protein
MNRQVVVNVILGCVFVAALVGVATGMFYLRGAALHTYGNEKSQADWDRWREDVAKDAKAFADAEKGEKPKDSAPLPPVKRRVSKSPEPPALLLMRERFGVCLAAALLLSGAMLGSILLLIRGAIFGGRSLVSDESD